MHPLVARFLPDGRPGPGLRPLLDLASEAGKRIEAVQAARDDDGIDVQTKGDGSPVTKADLASHHVLVDGLAAFEPALPVISEESHDPEAAAPDVAWVVDPLDGTKEFVKRNGEYVVNIGIRERGRPIFGAVHVPATGATFVGAPDIGAWRVTAPDAAPELLAPAPGSSAGPLRVVASRSHRGPDVDGFLARLDEAGLATETLPMGSAWKFLTVAEGRADCYPRFGPTMWWDTLAPQAVAEGAGCRVLGLDGLRLEYRRTDRYNPWFVVLGPEGPLDDAVWTALPRP